jgi:hypothetical protein
MRDGIFACATAKPMERVPKSEGSNVLYVVRHHALSPRHAMDERMASFLERPRDAAVGWTEPGPADGWGQAFHSTDASPTDPTPAFAPQKWPDLTVGASWRAQEAERTPRDVACWACFGTLDAVLIQPPVRFLSLPDILHPVFGWNMG